MIHGSGAAHTQDPGLGRLRADGEPLRAWTRSPYVALYFAVTHLEGDGAVWLLDAHALQEAVRRRRGDLLARADDPERRDEGLHDQGGQPVNTRPGP